MTALFAGCPVGTQRAARVVRFQIVGAFVDAPAGVADQRGRTE